VIQEGSTGQITSNNTSAKGSNQVSQTSSPNQRLFNMTSTQNRPDQFKKEPNEENFIPKPDRFNLK